VCARACVCVDGWMGEEGVEETFGLFGALK
jgi:hypothetical protein